MRLAVLSDLHLEGHRDHGMSFIDSLDPTGVDVLVLAGDICYLKEFYWAEKVYSAFCAKYKDVVEVLGNHSYYTSSFRVCQRNLSGITKGLSNLHILFGGMPKMIQNRRFIGGTLWFREDPLNALYSGLINDFNLIKDFLPTVYEYNTQTVLNLHKHMQPGDIVVTHHLPSYKCVSPRFKDSSLNRFFVCDMEDLIIQRRPLLYIHGHTHDPVDTLIGDTMMFSNPVGYKGENSNSDWLARSIIEV